MTTVLLVDDDALIRDGIAAVLCDNGYRTVLCSDAESAEIVLDGERIDALVADVRLSGPFRFEGLDLLDYAKRAAPRARLIAVSGAGAAGLAEAVEERGATFLAKPFAMAVLEALLPPANGAGGEIAGFPPLDELLSGELIVPKFQPIVRLGGPVIGFESLARIPNTSYEMDPAALFRYADRKQRNTEMNLTCLRRAIDHGAELPEGMLFFINVDGQVFSEADRLSAELSRSDRPVVLEITEQHPFHASPEALRTIDRLRERGIRFAFDDVGVAYSHLPLIGRIRPEYLKISQLFGTDFETDETRRKLVENVLRLARDFDATVILEGIESAATAEAARAMGIELGQGFWFG